MSLTVFLARYLNYILFLALPFLWLRKRRREAIEALFAAALARLLTDPLKDFFYHERPFVTRGLEPPLSHVADSSFPSSSAALAAALATAVFWQDKKWGVILWLGAILVGMARVLVGVHYPIDIAGGTILGIVAAFAVRKLLSSF